MPDFGRGLVTPWTKIAEAITTTILAERLATLAALVHHGTTSFVPARWAFRV